jgi:glyoxylate utilization-related uncharacterized protein
MLDGPPSLAGDRDAIPEPEYSPGLWRTELFGAGDARYDFSMIRMRFEPGVDLAMVELHEEEHGLYMTAGSGSYLLGSDEHAVRIGDFIYMAPFCPQSFVADPVEGAEYLLYKDVNRDGFLGRQPAEISPVSSRWSCISRLASSDSRITTASRIRRCAASDRSGCPARDSEA